MGSRPKGEVGKKGVSVFRGGWKNICIYPRSSPVPLFSPLYRPHDSPISAPASPYSEVSPAEATFASSLVFPLAFTPVFIPYPLLFPFLVSFISRSRVFSFSLFPSLIPQRSSFSPRPFALFLPLCLFFSLAQCASENMNPSPHCLRQRFSNFPPLCANDEGTKGRN